MLGPLIWTWISPFIKCKGEQASIPGEAAQCQCHWETSCTRCYFLVLQAILQPQHIQHSTLASIQTSKWGGFQILWLETSSSNIWRIILSEWAWYNPAWSTPSLLWALFLFLWPSSSSSGASSTNLEVSSLADIPRLFHKYHSSF